MTREQFIEKASCRHGDKYDYSQVEYVNSTTDVLIICPKHGEFWQKPVAHLRGSDCPLCSNEKRGKKRISNEELIDRFKSVHGDKYDYSSVEYLNANTKVTIICRQHGEFRQLPFAHLSGQECPKCKGIGLTKDDYIQKFTEIHGDRYDYSQSVFTKMKDKIKIICKEHGEFFQSPEKHLLGQGCPVCGKQQRSKMRSLTFTEFVNRSNETHDNKYEYDNDGFETAHSLVKITCQKHGKFTQRAYDHLNGHGCPSCGVIKSNNELEISEYIKEKIGPNKVVIGDRDVLNGKEIDVYVPDLKVGFEYNGCLWHSEKFGKGRQYHLSKTDACKQKGIKLIHIFEDEYQNNKEIVLSKIDNLLQCNDKPKIYARKCTVSEIDKTMAKRFLTENHIQGFSGGKVYLGCFHEQQLIGVMVFKHMNDNNWNLVRFATDIKHHCIGVGGKLFQFFIKHYDVDVIKTFADRRWTVYGDDNLYTKLGFQLTEILKPEYRYITSSDINRRHKFNFRKNVLHEKYGLPLTMTEKEMCDNLGFYKIWDCGLYAYEWHKDK